MQEITIAALTRMLSRMYPVAEPCIRCGDIGKHRHHPDYKKPFDIEWVCERCHRHTFPKIGVRPSRLMLTNKQYEFFRTFFTYTPRRATCS